LNNKKLQSSNNLSKKIKQIIKVHLSKNLCHLK